MVDRFGDITTLLWRIKGKSVVPAELFRSGLKIEVVKYSYIQAIVLSHYLFIPMSLPTCRHASEDREERNFFGVGEIFFFC